MKWNVGFWNWILTTSKFDGSLRLYQVFLAEMFFRAGMSSLITYAPTNLTFECAQPKAWI